MTRDFLGRQIHDPHDSARDWNDYELAVLAVTGYAHFKMHHNGGGEWFFHDENIMQSIPNRRDVRLPSQCWNALYPSGVGTLVQFGQVST